METETMKVTASVDVVTEVEVDVSIDAILFEFAERIEGGRLREVGPVVDSMTRMLAAMPNELITSFPEFARKLVHERLLTEAERWSIERRADPGDELGVCVRCGNAGELQEHHEGLGVCGGCKRSN